jgi:hypothetical protein
MEDFNNEYVMLLELHYTEHTRALLVDYVSRQYQEDADLSDESLKREFIWLYENNELARLFIGEYIHSQDRLRDEVNTIA